MDSNNFNQNGGYNNFNGQNSGFNNEQSREYYERVNFFRQKANAEKKQIRKYGNAVGLAMTANIVMQFVAVFVLKAANWYNLYDSSVVFSSSFNMIAISFLGVAVPFGIMALIFKKEYDCPVVPTKKIGGVTAMFWVFFGLGAAIVANILVAILMNFVNSLGYQLTQGESPAINSVAACIFSLVGTAVIPAICEEFAMRCCSLQLLKKYGKAFGVVSISIVFGILHGNVIQFVFAFLVGLILGFITVKTDSVIPAMFVHGINNSFSVTSDILKFAVNDSVANTTTSVIQIACLVLGIVGVVYLVLKGEFKKNKEVKEFSPYSLSTGKKVATFIFVPGMIFPLLFLIYLTCTTIVKI